MTRKLILATVLTAAGISGAGFAVAASSGNDTNDDMMEAQALASAQVTLNDASQIALQAVPGTLSEVGFDIKKGKGVWEASVIGSDGAEIDLLIDADTGAVLAKKAANDDDEDQDSEDGEDNESDDG